MVELDALVRPDDIQAIDVYDSPARVPTRFNVDAMCSAMVIWTRAAE